jgi:hypothetical protein
LIKVVPRQHYEYLFVLTISQLVDVVGLIIGKLRILGHPESKH